MLAHLAVNLARFVGKLRNQARQHVHREAGRCLAGQNTTRAQLQQGPEQQPWFHQVLAALRSTKTILIGRATFTHLGLAMHAAIPALATLTFALALVLAVHPEGLCPSTLHHPHRRQSTHGGAYTAAELFKHTTPVKCLALEGVLGTLATMHAAPLGKALGAQVEVRTILAREAQTPQRVHAAAVARHSTVLHRNNRSIRHPCLHGV
mmetsp:Transcript_48772/g.130893  ORF Transcript_48772/g.130893 Transcript_48772/m.130893 type:complete len:207 (+) Transcript_48772:830-1450(+)